MCTKRRGCSQEPKILTTMTWNNMSIRIARSNGFKLSLHRSLQSLQLALPLHQLCHRLSHRVGPLGYSRLHGRPRRRSRTEAAWALAGPGQRTIVDRRVREHSLLASEAFGRRWWRSGAAEAAGLSLLGSAAAPSRRWLGGRRFSIWRRLSSDGVTALLFHGLMMFVFFWEGLVRESGFFFGSALADIHSWALLLLIVTATLNFLASTLASKRYYYLLEFGVRTSLELAKMIVLLVIIIFSIIAVGWFYCHPPKCSLYPLSKQFLF